MYGTLADWRAWATDRGDNAPTAADDTLATSALVRASDYIEYAYVARFVSPYDGTSANVEPATYVAASFELATPGFFSKTFTPAQQKVLTGVGSVKWTPVTNRSNTRDGILAAPTSTLIEAMLGPYMPIEKGFAPYMKTINAQAE